MEQVTEGSLAKTKLAEAEEATLEEDATFAELTGASTELEAKLPVELDGCATSELDSTSAEEELAGSTLELLPLLSAEESGFAAIEGN